nr:MAG TPA: hypothetical protein [Caudoviricetes sp.]
MCVCKHKYIEQFGIQCNYYITYLFMLSQALVSKFRKLNIGGSDNYRRVQANKFYIL